MDYSWAANKAKLERASRKGKSEEEIKEEYIKMGGLVLKEAKKPGRPKKNYVEDSDLDPEEE